MNRQKQNLKRDLAGESRQDNLSKLYWQADRRRINQQPIPDGAGYAKPDTHLILRVQNEYFTAGAEFHRRDGVWSCIQAAPIIAWLKHTPFCSIKTEFLKRGCSWEWLPVTPLAASGTSVDKHESFTITSRTAARPDGHQASTPATGETQGIEKLLDQAGITAPTNSKCSAVPTT